MSLVVWYKSNDISDERAGFISRFEQKQVHRRRRVRILEGRNNIVGPDKELSSIFPHSFYPFLVLPSP
jgi:hypothetical protein